jgi:hypothetical protein
VALLLLGAFCRLCSLDFGKWPSPIPCLSKVTHAMSYSPQATSLVVQMRMDSFSVGHSMPAGGGFHRKAFEGLQVDKCQAGSQKHFVAKPDKNSGIIEAICCRPAWSECISRSWINLEGIACHVCVNFCSTL